MMDAWQQPQHQPGRFDGFGSPNLHYPFRDLCPAGQAPDVSLLSGECHGPDADCGEARQLAITTISGSRSSWVA
jgi:hypothetical protein